MIISSDDLLDTRSTLLASFLSFTKIFYKLLTGRDFIISNPKGRESHFITIARELTKCARLETNRLMINVPPGYGKSTLVSFWVAWTIARYPDSNFLYISYSKELAVKHTATIKRIMSLTEYRDLFGIYIAGDSKSKEFFQTTQGATISAHGSSGTITGLNAGLPGLDRFSGALIMDDMHKPDEAHSDTVRGKVLTSYRETIEQRVRGLNVPMIFIGQRLHEDDLGAFFINKKDGYDWRQVILKAIDDAGNALYPEKDPIDKLLIKQSTDIYTFAAQFQQDPQPAGGALYRPEFFPMLDEEPQILCTFITCDTAETDKSYNDATVFSFWGLYEIETMGRNMKELALHWLDCYEIRVEPKDLKNEFLNCWSRWALHKMPPLVAAIEKKSTGVTLLSVFDELRGLQIRNIERNITHGSKTQRFLNIQPYIASKRVTFTQGAKHASMCIEHMRKITANNTHAFDDICDTAADAIRIALIEKTLYYSRETEHDLAARSVASELARRIAARKHRNL